VKIQIKNIGKQFNSFRYRSEILVKILGENLGENLGHEGQFSAKD